MEPDAVGPAARAFERPLCRDETEYRAGVLEALGNLKATASLPAVSTKSLLPVRVERFDKNRKGLVVSTEVRSGEPIAEYSGVFRSKTDFHETLPASMRTRACPHVWFHPKADVCIDARSSGGTTRYVRRSCRPNAVVKEARIGSRRVAVVWALRDIAKGTEATVAFDFEPASRPYRVPCACDHASCPIRRAEEAKSREKRRASSTSSIDSQPQPQRSRKESSPLPPGGRDAGAGAGTGGAPMSREERKMAAIMAQFARLDKGNSSSPASPKPASPAPDGATRRRARLPSTPSAPAAKQTAKPSSGGRSGRGRNAAGKSATGGAGRTRESVDSAAPSPLGAAAVSAANGAVAPSHVYGTAAGSSAARLCRREQRRAAAEKRPRANDTPIARYNEAVGAALQKVGLGAASGLRPAAGGLGMAGLPFAWSM